MHIACAWDYRGRRVQQGPVVYLAFEGGLDFRTRVLAWRRRTLSPDCDADIPFYLLDAPVDLVADQAALVAAISGQPPCRFRSIADSHSDGSRTAFR